MARCFLFLQGPHGPFFRRLASALVQAGATVRRVGVNAGDAWAWGSVGPYLALKDPQAQWAERLDQLIVSHGVTDIVYYGDARPLHQAAHHVAEARGLTIHVFEEGYLRPHWVTYERDGVNGASAVMGMSMSEILDRLPPEDTPLPHAPDQWGTAVRHAYSSALYHAHVATGARSYPGYQPHRGIGVWRELSLNLAKLARVPVTALVRRAVTQRLLQTGAPYHLALLQLGHDSAVQAHSPYSNMAGFIDDVAEAFASGAPRHHHLVFKTHPFDDNREPISALVRRASARQGLAGRTHVIPGGPLAGLLGAAESAVTINSTAAQQALWRALPVKSLGRAVYTRPELVSDQTLADFFAAPKRPDHQAYLAFRRFLLFTSQIKGSFYTNRGRADILREAVDRMLSPEGPYERLLSQQ